MILNNGLDFQVTRSEEAGNSREFAFKSLQTFVYVCRCLQIMYF